MINIAVLVSGGGTNLEALIKYEAECRLKGELPPYHISLVISDRSGAFALERAKRAGIQAETFSPASVMGREIAQKATRIEKREAVSLSVLSSCTEHKINAIVLAGYLTVLTGKLIDTYKNRIINLHPALLPKFGGLGMWGMNVHRAVLESGEKESGCTVHIVTRECDAGEILLQKRLRVLPTDTPESLASRISSLEHEAIVEGAVILSERITREKSENKV